MAAATHTADCIQPHGVLLAVDPLLRFRIVAASRNAAPSLQDPGVGTSLLGRDIGEVLGEEFAEALRARHAEDDLRCEMPWHCTVELLSERTTFYVAAHESSGVVLLELERAAEPDEPAALDAWQRLQDAIVQLHGVGNDLGDVARVIARAIRRVAGYERVVIWRFDPDLNGHALFEDKVADWDHSLLHVRLLAADLAHSLRDLHTRCQVRWVPDRDAVPAPIDVEPGWTAAEPESPGIVLSCARLRTASAMRLRFFRNVGAMSVLSLPIVCQGRPWGLMACHHRRPHHPSPAQRMAVATLVDAFAVRVGPAERAKAEEARREDLDRLSALLAHMAQAETVTAALTTGQVTIANLFDVTGAAMLCDGAVSLLGNTPPEAAVRDLARWLGSHPSGAALFESDSLPDTYPPWTVHTDIACGVLAVFLSADRSEILLWFRPEAQEVVTWASSLQTERPGAGASSHPPLERRVEMRRGHAKPWAERDLEIAETLRHAITEVIVRSLRRIADLHEQLRQSQKMEAVGQLTGGIAHDFNNLLTGIIGSLELMQARVEHDRTEDLGRYCAAAIGSAKRAASVTHRLLAFSRRQTLDPKPVDVARLMGSMEELIRRTVGPAVELVTTSASDLWHALCDAHQLENALLNLAINARDAMPDGGRLTIAAVNAPQGQFVSVSVADTGSGMSPETMARVFEPFFTTKPLGQGTGLGLSMVYGFAEQSNGLVRLESEPGRGTTVRLSLPCCPEGHEAEREAVMPPAGATAGAGRSVLLVDDEAVVRMLVGDVLRDLGHHVIEAADGAEALRVLRSGQPVDLLVSDVGLPGGLNGRQLADAARAGRPKLKVLFITGYAEGALLGDGGGDRDTEVIVKPFGMNVLAARIQAMV